LIRILGSNFGIHIADICAPGRREGSGIELLGTIKSKRVN